MRPCSAVQELISVSVVLHALIDQVARSTALGRSQTMSALPALTADAFVAGALPEGARDSPAHAMLVGLVTRVCVMLAWFPHC